MLDGFNHQNISISIEHILRNIFKCDRLGFGGIADADEVRRNPYLCMVVGLTYIYQSKDVETKGQIERFIEKYSYYSNHTVDELYEENQQDLKDMVHGFKELIG